MHQGSFFFGDIFYLGLVYNNVIGYISALNCVSLMGYMLNKCCYAKACVSLHQSRICNGASWEH